MKYVIGTNYSFMDTTSLFHLIDIAIAAFSADRDFIVSIDSHSDWLVFDYRKVFWTYKEINYQVEIFPSFDDHEQITSWILDACAWYDEGDFRYSLGKEILKNVQLDYLAENITDPLDDAFRYLDRIEKKDIPKAINLKDHTSLE